MTTTKFCSYCNKETVHNRRGKLSLNEYRCTGCGNPPRPSTAHDKNKVMKIGGKVMWGPR